MDLTRSILKDFADITKESSNKPPESNYVRGTIQQVGDSKYVKIDGSEGLTPIAEVVDAEHDDRVLVTIERHRATVLGNFTFPPSARKEEEALNKAEDANNNSNMAVNKAEEAGQKADSAIADAGLASSLAQESVKKAEEAFAAADNANKNLEETKELANSAVTKADEAIKQSGAAQENVANARNEIDRINQTVEGVKGDIASTLTELGELAKETETIKETMEVEYTKKTELSTVEASLKSEISKSVGELQATVEQNYAAKNDVVELEGKLQTQITQNAQGLSSQATKVEKLESDTQAAQAQVDQALANAEKAQNAAAQAQTDAEFAQTAADQAKADALLAQTKAEESQKIADAANAAASAADKKVQEAQGDLNEAKQNLANVTNRVGATEQEIAEAQAKVDAAQISVNKALADAATANTAASKAQQAADQAQTNAENAQNVAANAQEKAENATVVANKAQADAEKAQQDVAALTKRVTTAETQISQTAEQVEINASKTEEIGNLLQNNYYNKTETDAKFKVQADSITSTVKKEVTTEIGKIEIGGRNLLLNTEEGRELVGTGITNEATTEYRYSDYGKKVLHDGSSSVLSISYDWKTENATSGTIAAQAYSNVLSNIGTVTLSSTNKSGHVEVAYNIPSTWKGSSNIGIRFVADKVTGTVIFSNLKVELGNKATDWSPAPEDISNDVTNAQNAANNAQADVDNVENRVSVSETTIKQLSDSIASLVTDENGSSLMTQTSDGWTFNIGAINKTLNEASDKLNAMAGDMAEVDNAVNNLNKLANDLAKKTAYIVMTTDDSGAPCIELGKEGNEFKVRITNTSVDFMAGSSKIAYINNQALYIERAIIKNELQIGEGTGFIWKRRPNGNMGLRWIGG